MVFATAPSNRINVAVIGNGNQSTLDLPAFLQQDDVQVVAVCDVNTASHGYRTPEQFLGRKPAQEKVDAYYAGKAASGRYSGCKAYNDFRDVLARADVDAVAIIVPDHWHALMTIAAAKAGKDIYCEKPMSLTVRQGQAMVQAVRAQRRILQTGSQYRSNPTCRFACELVRNGRIGQVKKVTTLVPENNAVDPGPGWKPMPVPAGFDYDLWLGPAPKAPYHAGRCFYRFRFIRDYSGGQTTNFGAHAFDIVQCALGMNRTGPVEFEDAASEWPPPGGLYNTATKVHFRARYADGVELECVTRKPFWGVRFEGTEGWINFGYDGVKSHPESIATSKIAAGEMHLPVAVPEGATNVGKDLIFDHVRNFVAAVKSRRDPIEPVEIGHRSATICHLGNIAMLLKQKIRWDPAKEEIVGNVEAAGMLTRPMRALAIGRFLSPGQWQNVQATDPRRRFRRARRSLRSPLHPGKG